jgi:NAD(P)-dependent dehydrogenase (short-subunit alcohol dehydrogenase family)
MGELRFDGRSVVVTGGGRGIGRCHALLFAARGARVVVADSGAALDGTGSSPEPADDVVREITDAGGSAVACHASVAEPDGAAEIVRTAVESFGGLDVVVNNAGVAELAPFEELSLEAWHRLADVHLFGTVHVLREAWPHLVACGQGRVVNTFSEGALGKVPKNSAYGSTKASVLGITRTLALEGGNRGIAVNAVTPRANTRFSAPEVLARTFDLPATTFEGVMDVMRPELVSPVVAFLAHQSCPLNGEVLVAGGGQVMRMAIVANEGITRPDLTPEDVADDLEHIMDLAGGHVVSVEQFIEATDT